ncbi:PH domain-containing protein [Kibdelosporangium aridum]|uniref:PH domain-containing protein n=1 Tax=Kibdelosporangium aridum TaxID=2030 RepID=A0A1Y5Y488_KIBAR|nr:PH domain-containing protein [Kibdelosporangium aridum]SMD23593.1 PH domain-containing protein [Kibdelosporangium aridum]
MPSSDRLPWPAEWPHHSGRRYVPGIVLLVLFGLAAFAAGLGFVAIGAPGGLKYGSFAALLFMFGAFFIYYTRVRRPAGYADVRSGNQATEVRYSLVAFVCLIAQMGCFTALFVFAVVDYARHGITAAAIAFGGLGLGVATFVVGVLSGRVRRGRLTLSADGIEQRGWTFSSFLPWEAFAGVKAAYNGRPEVLVIAYANAEWRKQQVVRFWKIDRLPPVPMIEVDCAQFAVPPEGLYALLKHYVEHPEARTELGTDAVLARLRR